MKLLKKKVRRFPLFYITKPFLLIWKWNIFCLTSLSKLVPAAVVGLSSGLYGLNRVLKFSGTEREDLRAGAGLGWPHPWKTWKRHCRLYDNHRKREANILQPLYSLFHIFETRFDWHFDSELSTCPALTLRSIIKHY